MGVVVLRFIPSWLKSLFSPQEEPSTDDVTEELFFRRRVERLLDDGDLDRAISLFEQPYDKGKLDSLELLKLGSLLRERDDPRSVSVLQASMRQATAGAHDALAAVPNLDGSPLKTLSFTDALDETGIAMLALRRGDQDLIAGVRAALDTPGFSHHRRVMGMVAVELTLALAESGEWLRALVLAEWLGRLDAIRVHGLTQIGYWEAKASALLYLRQFSAAGLAYKQARSTYANRIAEREIERDPEFVVRVGSLRVVAALLAFLERPARVDWLLSAVRQARRDQLHRRLDHSEPYSRVTQSLLKVYGEGRLDLSWRPSSFVRADLSELVVDGVVKARLDVRDRAVLRSIHEAWVSPGSQYDLFELSNEPDTGVRPRL